MRLKLHYPLKYNNTSLFNFSTYNEENPISSTSICLLVKDPHFCLEALGLKPGFEWVTVTGVISLKMDIFVSLAPVCKI